jgi:hypothetical protein
MNNTGLDTIPAKLSAWISGLNTQQIMVCILAFGFTMFFAGFGKQLAGLAVLAVIYLLLSGSPVVEGMLDGTGFVLPNTKTQAHLNATRCKLLSEIRTAIPEIGTVEKIHNRLTRFADQYTLEINSKPIEFQHEFVSGLIAKLEFYFTSMYSAIYTLVTEEIYPQHIMINIITFQQRILNQIQEFIFVGVGSHLAPELDAINSELKAAYYKLNAQIAEKVNSKRSDVVNNLSGYVDYPNEPLPMGSFTTDEHTLF